MQSATKHAHIQIGCRWIRRVAFCALLLFPALAAAEDCSEFPNGTIDGFAGDIAPSQIQIDRNCTIRNFPASNPLATNFSFLTQPGQTQERWLIVFDNVVHTGQMACNSVAGHKIWFTNGSSTSIQEGCQNLLIPVEKIDKQNPVGTTAATVGVPFTYTMTMPVLFDPATSTVINVEGSLNTLHGVTLVDDLNETGVDLRYLSHRAYWRETGVDVAHTFDNANGLLTFDNFPIVPAGQQIVIEMTVVLEDTPQNAIGTQFINIARWDFGRLIDGVFYEPLPGEWGISEPLTIAAPNLIVDKSAPATANLGQAIDYTLDLHNAGSSAAWDVTLVDRLPNRPNGGLCAQPPALQSLQVFQADGVTPVVGKGALQEGSDYTVTWADAPSCELRLEFRGAAASIGADERLVVRYQTVLDPDTRQGADLTNIAGATQWFNGDAGNVERQAYSRTVTNGTPGTADHQDAHTLTADLSGYVFEKRVLNVDSGADPARTARPGERLRYTLFVRSTDAPLTNARILDDLGAMNGSVVFEPGSLTLVSVPPGADTSATDPQGGTRGAGQIDIRNLNLSADSSLSIEFEVTLADVIANATVVSNQAELWGVTKLADSDDPTVNGQADPDVPGDEDPTQLVIESGPALDIDKISVYLDGDPNVLLAGERLRYRITVANTGTDEATSVQLRDALPTHTIYIANSTTLNGAALPDQGGFPLADGVLLSTPGDPTPGTLPVNTGSDSIAVVEFDVTVDPDLADGTVLSNQGFVTAPDDGLVDVPSDDPRTAAPDDPTLDVVGNFPLMFSTKTALLEIDGGSPGIVDPGDTLRYTITVHNNGPVEATGVRLTDAVPAGTTYVADSVTLNGTAVAQPDGGVSPLIDGLWIASADRPVPLDAADAVVSSRESAVVQFSLRVNDDVERGTLIVNQATVVTSELGESLTDGDGNPSTGPEPTVVVVGDAQQLAITKQVGVVGGGPVLADSVLEYLVTVRNLGAVPAQSVFVTDVLDDPEPGQLLYVEDSARLNNGVAGVSEADGTLIADYSAEFGPLPPGQAFELRFRARVEPTLAIGTRVVNQAYVTWNTDQTALAEIAVDVGGTPGSGTLSGSVWHDADFDDQADPDERVLEGWTVLLQRNGETVHTAIVDAEGVWRIAGVLPNYLTDDTYEIVFAAPGAGPATAKLGRAVSEFDNDLQRIFAIEVRSGSNLVDMNLPIDPNGVVYDALSRRPVSGARLELLDAVSGIPLPDECFDDGAQQGQQTLISGYYKFDLNFSRPACAASEYRIRVQSAPGYLDGIAELVAPPADASQGPLNVPVCAIDAIPATTGFCEVQPSEFAPPAAAGNDAQATRYFLSLVLDDTGVPRSSQAFNNHLPLDPVLDGVVSITKSTPMVNVSRGQMIPYTITVASSWPLDLTGVQIVDRYPVGFKYVEGSASFDEQPLEPEVFNGELVWSGLRLRAESEHSVTLLLTPGAGVTEGKYTNRAQSILAQTGQPLSGIATATVRVVPDPTFDCTDATGKVFEDDNRNGYQDDGELGIAGARLVTTTGLSVTTDAHGRFHITCVATPHPGRGSNVVLKLDDRSLPAGFRASTKGLQVQRATRGKALHFRFGASLHRVVGLDVADAVFEPDEVAIRPYWLPRIEQLMEELRKGPSVLRLTYTADLESRSLVSRRMRTLRRTLLETWRGFDCCYRLEIEQDVLWRTGKPVEQDARLRAGREASR